MNTSIHHMVSIGNRPARGKEIQQLSQFIPLVVLIPKSHVKDQVFVPKISAEPLRQNLEASTLLRQSSKCTQQYRGANGNPEFVFGDAALDFSAMEGWRDGKLVPLTPMEFKVLSYLIRNEARVISRDEPLKEVWDMRTIPAPEP